jgi:hypothetical protein
MSSESEDELREGLSFSFVPPCSIRRRARGGGDIVDKVEVRQTTKFFISTAHKFGLVHMRDDSILN